jgi:hypothetical protein
VAIAGCVCGVMRCIAGTRSTPSSALLSLSLSLSSLPPLCICALPFACRFLVKQYIAKLLTLFNSLVFVCFLYVITNTNAVRGKCDCKMGCLYCDLDAKFVLCHRVERNNGNGFIVDASLVQPPPRLSVDIDPGLVELRTTLLKCLQVQCIADG